MEKKKRGEKEKAKEEREVGSRTESNNSKAKEIWRVAEVVEADSIRKTRGEEKLDGDGTSGIAEAFSALGKKNEGKER